MIQSMTGFSSVSCDLDNLHINLEIKSVNHRYLDIQIKRPEELRSLENQIREKIQSKTQRGKIECRINLLPLKSQDSELPSLNSRLLNHLIGLNREILTKDNTLLPLSVAEILKFPNIIQLKEIDETQISHAILQLADQALAEFCASRQKEGEKLKEHITQRLDSIVKIIHDIEKLMPNLLETHKEKLTNRLKEALMEVQDDRVAQEFALFIQKSDTDEELSRIKTHVEAIRHILEQKNAAGKRLDFFMQELNREANTLGSKSISIKTTQASVDLKVLIEQMREQIQNIE